jgi:hypothetical protein
MSGFSNSNNNNSNSGVPTATFVSGSVVPKAVVPKAVVPKAVVPKAVVAGAVVPETVVPGIVVSGEVVAVKPKLCKKNGCTECVAMNYDDNQYFDYCLNHQEGCCFYYFNRCCRKDESYKGQKDYICIICTKISRGPSCGSLDR